MNKHLKDLPMYHFDRGDFCRVFEEVFTYDEYIEIDVLCSGQTFIDEFALLRWEDEFYILHLKSGTMINWYKHMGRTNTCNKPDFTLDDFRAFLQKLREELVWDGKIKDDALRAKLEREWYSWDEE